VGAPCCILFEYAYSRFFRFSVLSCLDEAVKGLLEQPLIFLVITVAAVILLNVITSYQITAGIIELRKQELRRIVTLELKVIEPIRRSYTSREITRDEALTRILDVIRSMIYDAPQTRNYLFMSSFDGTMLVQPFEPEKEGTDQWDLKIGFSVM